VRSGGIPLPGQAGRAGQIRQMFERIAPTYDLLNRVLALRLDVRWRRRLVDALDPKPGQRILDLCAGTLDVAAAIAARAPGARVIGADFAQAMLRRGRAKTGLPAAGADALALPFRDGSFDLAAVAFGLRNLDDLYAGLAEARRVLRPGGRLGVLEFFPPRTAGARALHRAWDRALLPWVGRVISRDRSAYRYLADSIGAFNDLPSFEATLKRAGFDGIYTLGLFPGICSVVTARRAP
jgi:ubiquinone/menaquinone biosynthesis methyltransferase